MKCKCGHPAKYHEGWSAPGKSAPGCCKILKTTALCPCMKWEPLTEKPSQEVRKA